jgi:hypothetical protein
VERQFLNFFFFRFFLELQIRLEGNDISFPLQLVERNRINKSVGTG